MQTPYREAAAVLQGSALLETDTLRRLDGTRIAAVADALEQVRTQISDLRGAIADRPADALCVHFLSDTARRFWPAGPADSILYPITLSWTFRNGTGSSRVGLARVDSLNQRYLVRQVNLSRMGDDPGTREPRFEAWVWFAF
jgi:hypothetical protein